MASTSIIIYIPRLFISICLVTFIVNYVPLYLVFLLFICGVCWFLLRPYNTIITKFDPIFALISPDDTFSYLYLFPVCYISCHSIRFICSEHHWGAFLVKSLHNYTQIHYVLHPWFFAMHLLIQPSTRNCHLINCNYIYIYIYIYTYII